jgi:four helix bundle protein
MAKYNILQEKSFAFAVKVVKLYKFLCEEQKEFVLSKQILRSGTSICANIEEGIAGQSDKDFLSKFCISYKEARETIYWLKLFFATDYLTKEQADSLIFNAEELCKILSKIIITTKNKLSKPSLNS